MSEQQQSQKLTEVSAQEKSEDILTNQNEEEDQIDEETKKAVQNAKFDVNAFISSSIKANKKDIKNQLKEHTKTKQKKAVDYYDYAQKNGLNYKIQYEDDQKPTKKNNETAKKIDEKPEPKYNKTYQEKKQYHEGSNQGYNKKSKKYNNYYDDQYNQKPVAANKFDYFDSMLQQQNAYYLQNNQYNYQPVANEVTQNFQKINIDDHQSENSEKLILDSLIYYFSIENLNKDSYIRSKLDENGFLEANEIINFNKMKEYSVTIEKIKSVLNLHDTNIEFKFEDGKLFLRNKNWETIKNNLESIEKLKERKKLTQNSAYGNYQYYYQYPLTGQINDPNAYHQMQQIYNNPYQNVGGFPRNQFINPSYHS